MEGVRMAEARKGKDPAQEHRLAKFKSLEMFELFANAAEKVFLTIYDESVTILDKKNMVGNFLSKLTAGLESDSRALLDILSTVEFGNRFVSHSLKVTVISVILGKRMGLIERRLMNLAIAAFLHDIGKAHSSNKYLNSYFKELNSEQEIHLHHPEVGAAIAEEYFGFTGEVGQLIIRHHEQPDGKGFPAGLDNLRLTLADKILFSANFIDNVLCKSDYSGVDNIRRVMRNILDKFPEKFDKAIVNEIIELTSTPVISNRRFERISLSLPCTFKLWQDQRSFTGRILDISATGLLLRTKAQLELQMLLRMSFSLTGVISFTDREARVVRRDVDDRGFVYGLSFEDESDSAKVKMDRYINKYIGKPEK